MESALRPPGDWPYILTCLVRKDEAVKTKRNAAGDKPSRRSAALARLRGWKLEDAKARFSEVVRLARDEAPQRVTVHGEDAVVLLSAADYARLAPLAQQPDLYALVSNSPLRDLDFGAEGVRSPVRDIPL